MKIFSAHRWGSGDRNAHSLPGAPSTRWAKATRIVTALVKEPLRERLGVRNETLGAELTRLLTDGQLVHAEGRRAVPVPP